MLMEISQLCVTKYVMVVHQSNYSIFWTVYDTRTLDISNFEAIAD